MSKSINATVRIVCPECKRDDFKRNADLGNHRLRVHGVAGSSSASLSKYRALQAQGKPLPAEKHTTASTPVAVAEPDAMTCPECLKEGIVKTFPNNRLRGTHRRRAHNVAGTSASSILQAKRLQAAGVEIIGPFPCPECGKVLATRAGRVNHRHNAHHISYDEARERMDLIVQASGLGRTGRPTNESKGLPTKQKKSHHKKVTMESVLTPATTDQNQQPQLAPTPTPAPRAKELTHAQPQNNHHSPEEEYLPLITLAVGSLEKECHTIAFQNDLPAKQFTRWVAKYLQLQAGR